MKFKLQKESKMADFSFIRDNSFLTQKAYGPAPGNVFIPPNTVEFPRPPTSADDQYPVGQIWRDTFTPDWYIYDGSDWTNWTPGAATTTTFGSVELSDDIATDYPSTDVPTVTATKDYVDSVAIAGAPAWSETVSGIGQLSTTAEAQAGTNDTTAMTPAKVVDLLETPPAIGGTTPGAGSFTTLGATGAVDFDAGGSWESGGAAIDIGADASTDAINVGTGAAARTITVGNTSGATAIALTSGTGHITLTSTGTGDIILDSDDTMLLDSDGVLELNSSGGVISIGNDDIDQNINLGTDGERVITIGSNNGAAQTDIEAGSGGINIGTAASAQSVSIGNTTGATAIAMLVGTGNFSLDGATATTYTVGASTTTGTISIGGTAQTGTITLGDSSGTNTVQIGSGEGDTTVAIAGGATNGKTVTIADGAVANAVTIGSASGASSLNLLCGTGNFTLDGAATSTYAIGATTTSGTITIGGTAQTGTLGLGVSSGAMTTNLSTGNGAKTLNVATGISGNTLNVASGANTSAQTVNISSGASAADSDVNILSGNGSAGTQTLNVLTGNRAGALNLATGSAAHVISIGSASAGVVTVDTAAGISIDAATASNLSVSGATEDLTLESAAGRVIINAGEDAADTIYLHADAGTGEKIRIHSDQGTGADSVELESDVGGITLTSGLASADAINLSASAGGVDVDGALQVNIASSQADPGALTLAVSNAAGGITHTGKCIYTPDAITSDNAGVAASVSTCLTQITTDGDSNEDNVTLADGVDGQLKIFAVVAAGNAADSVKITPANMAGGSKITFAADPTGLGCSMIFDGTNWTVVGNNGGTIA